MYIVQLGRNLLGFLDWRICFLNKCRNFEAIILKFRTRFKNIMEIFSGEFQTNRTDKTPMASDRVKRPIPHATAEDVDLQMRVPRENRYKTLDSTRIQLKFGTIGPR